jgi:hypothetical protein
LEIKFEKIVEWSRRTQLLREIEESLKLQSLARRLMFLPAESECLQRRWNELVFTT